jgi:hypothetical protein
VDPVAHLLHTAHPVDHRDPRVAVAVVTEDRGGLRPVLAHALSDDLRRVIGAVLVPGATEQALHELVHGHVQEQDEGDPTPTGAEHGIEGLHLSDGAREAVQHHPSAGIIPAQPLVDGTDDEIVGDELPRGHQWRHLSPEPTAGTCLGPQHVAGGDVEEGELGTEEGGLRSLAASRWSGEHGDQGTAHPQGVHGLGGGRCHQTDQAAPPRVRPSTDGGDATWSTEAPHDRAPGRTAARSIGER